MRHSCEQSGDHPTSAGAPVANTAASPGDVRALELAPDRETAFPRTGMLIWKFLAAAVRAVV
jgi:hypothetical protein